jgi:hypothetical protein
MTETQTFFIETIKLVPDGSVCFIQAPSIDDYDFQQTVQTSEFPYFQQLVLTLENKERLSELVKMKPLEEYFQSLEIRQEGTLLFEAFDGMEIGTFSKKFILPDEFENKYKSLGMLTVSSEW